MLIRQYRFAFVCVDGPINANDLFDTVTPERFCRLPRLLMVKRPELNADHLPLYSVEINAWSFSCCLPDWWSDEALQPG
jgi:hypothetical protein